MESLDCDICFQGFDESDRLPRTLPCGHSFCHTCIIKSLKEGPLLCPSCRKTHAIDNAGEVSVNYTLLKVAGSLRASRETLPTTSRWKPSLTKAKPLSQEPKLHAGICGEHGSFRLFWCGKCEVWICRDCTVVDHPPPSCPALSARDALERMKEGEKEQMKVSAKLRNDYITHLQDYQDKLSSYDAKVDKQLEAFQEILQGQTVLKTMIKKEQDVIKSFLSEGSQSERKMSDFHTVLKKSETIEDTEGACHAGQRCRKEIENWIQSTREKTNDFTALQQCDEQYSRHGQILQMTKYWHNKLFSPTVSALLSYMKSKDSEDHLTKNDLKILTSLAPVWAVQSKSKSAPVTQSGESLLLHALKLQSPPEDAVILPYDEIVALGKQCPQVFLDLSWGGGKKETTYIQMEALSPAREASGKKAFFQLCTGEGDKSFLGSNMKEAPEKDCPRGRGRLCWEGDGRGVNINGTSLTETNITPGLVTCSLSGNSLRFSVWYKSSINEAPQRSLRPHYDDELDPYSPNKLRQFSRDPYSSPPIDNVQEDLYAFPRAGADPYSSGSRRLVDKSETLGVVTKNLQIIEEAVKRRKFKMPTILDSGLVIKDN